MYENVVNSKCGRGPDTACDPRDSCSVSFPLQQSLTNTCKNTCFSAESRGFTRGFPQRMLTVRGFLVEIDLYIITTVKRVV